MSTSGVDAIIATAHLAAIGIAPALPDHAREGMLGLTTHGAASQKMLTIMVTSPGAAMPMSFTSPRSSGGDSDLQTCRQRCARLEREAAQ
jgi:hypothetical protein